jgi:hypothetical protein
MSPGHTSPTVVSRRYGKSRMPNMTRTIIFEGRRNSINDGGIYASCSFAHKVECRTQGRRRAPSWAAHLYWNPVPGAEMYDLIQGDLSDV